MQTISDAVARLSQWSQRLSAWLCIALVALTTEQVIARYLFNASSVAMQELEWHLFGAIFLFASAATFKRDEHVRVDIFYTRLSAGQKAALNLIGFWLLFVPPVVTMIYFGVDSTFQSLDYTMARPEDFWSARWFGEGTLYELSAGIEGVMRKFILVGESSPDPGGLDARWIIKACVPAGMLLLLLQGLALSMRDLLVVIGRQDGA